MPRTLYGKLVLALVVLLCLMALIYIPLTLFATRLYRQEVTQKLNQTLAGNIVHENQLIQDNQVNQPALEELFHDLMVINPSIEVYLLDPEGRIVAYSAPRGKVKRDSVSLGSVRDFLEGNREYPILGDDPRDSIRQKVFSAAPVHHQDVLEGYLYVVLGGEQYESVAQMLRRSYVLRLSLGIAAAGLIFVLVAGTLSFNWLTRRLRRLTAMMHAFKQGGFQQPVPSYGWRGGKGGDEIDQLGSTFEEMSARITDQINRLQQADERRREMIANISHDLRTPLASLQGYLDTLSIKESELPSEERRQYLALALKHSQRLGRLIEELFELASLEARETQVRWERFSMSELLQDVVQKFALEARQKELRLETEIPQDAPYVCGEIGLIERVMENLIENAIKYTPPGGTVRLSLMPGPNDISMRITDTGRGIPEEDLPHIFDRFYRVEKYHPEAPEGTGLGLAIARQILKLHGSTITVESTAGRGTSFTFHLPFHRPRTAA
jgi:signal transduction histidine kinase